MEQDPTNADSNNQPSFLSPWMDTEKAALYIDCKPATLKTWRGDGEGPRYYAVSRRLVRYHKDDLDAFLRSVPSRG